MSEPKIAQKSPCKVDLEPGTYYFCTCGESKNQPLCDGSHKGTDFAPMEFEIKQKGDVWLCGCKHTKTPPFCDGSHKNL
ncbi:MAG: CDGSH iron-sulfur domain-containing protein [Gammaproteobacteria bacterium]|nr:CDGSH iron-sulfur domain-containing protein [Gammaproteobacteria bacterium]MDH5594793.1 CDGSH iron-sulfur domain-containing protein [Gammaproteobacteria bacterium]